jgi:hypothetical protein
MGMDTTRRSILKMFGVTAVAGAAGASAVVEAAKEGRTISYAPPPAPNGFTYQWKRVFIKDDTPDFDNLVDMIKHGWKPVPASRHRDVYPEDGSYWVEIGGLVLMEKRTAELTPPRALETPSSLDDYFGS